MMPDRNRTRVLLHISVHFFVTHAECGYGNTLMKRLAPVGYNALFNQLRQTDGEHFSQNTQVLFALKAAYHRFRYPPDAHLYGIAVFYKVQYIPGYGFVCFGN